MFSIYYYIEMIKKKTALIVKLKVEFNLIFGWNEKKIT